MPREYLFDRPDWFDQAACRGKPLYLWFPDDKTPISKAAKQICDSCPVKQECLDYGVENEFYGVWGGLSSRKRSKMRAEKRISLGFSRISKEEYND